MSKKRLNKKVVVIKVTHLEVILACLFCVGHLLGYFCLICVSTKIWTCFFFLYLPKKILFPVYSFLFCKFLSFCPVYSVLFLYMPFFPRQNWLSFLKIPFLFSVILFCCTVLSFLYTLSSLLIPIFSVHAYLSCSCPPFGYMPFLPVHYFLS